MVTVNGELFALMIIKENGLFYFLTQVILPP